MKTYRRQGRASCLIGHVRFLYCFWGFNLTFHIIIVGINDSCCVEIGHAVANVRFDCRGNVNFSRTIIKTSSKK